MTSPKNQIFRKSLKINLFGTVGERGVFGKKEQGGPTYNNIWETVLLGAVWAETWANRLIWV